MSTPAAESPEHRPTDDTASGDGACCAPGRTGTASTESSDSDHRPSSQPSPEAGELVDIPGGSFVMGTDEEYRYPGDGEGPAREDTVSAYRIGK
jgi:sulfatase modifying factor 1